MSRVRLTQRNAADMSIPYPGNVNQPDRKDPSWEQYHTFEQTVNHELPDMRHEWKDNPRDDIGFGIPEANPPTVASVRIAANKAVRIAVLLLGEKVEDEVIEAQARDLMAMTGDAMDRTLSRFADTQKFYAEDKDEDDKKAAKDDDKDEKKADDKEDGKDIEKKAKRVWDKDEKKWVESAEKDDKEDDKKASAALVKKDDKKAEDKDDEKDEKKAEDKKEDKKEIPEFIQEKIDESKEKKSKDEEKDEDKKATDDKDEDDKKHAADKDEEKVEEKTAGVNELNIELTGAADEDVKPDPEADKKLAALFADDGLTAVEEEKDEEEVKASKKAGIKKLGGQPKVASVSGESVDISSLWESAPDVSQVFK